MSTTFINKLVAAGQFLTGKVYRPAAGLSQVTGVALPHLINPNNSLQVSWSIADGTKDAFGRIRTATPAVLGTIKQIYDDAPLQMVESLSGGATRTYVSSLASSELTTNTSASTAIRQTRRYFPYEPGRTMTVFFSGRFGAATAGTRKRMGYFDANNGIFFEQSETSTLNIVLRNNGTDTVVPQSAWSYDKLDGTGRSGATLDPTKYITFFIGFGWMGSGVSTGIIINGSTYFANTFDISQNVGPFMRTASLPVRWEIENISSGVSDTLLQTACAVFSEGGFDPEGVVVARPLTSTRNAGVLGLPLLAIRLKSAYSRGLIVPIAASGLITTNDDVIFRVYARATVIGGSWNDTETGRSEYNSSAIGMVGGIPIATFFANENAANVTQEIRSSLAIAADFAGNADQLVLFAQTDTQSASVLGSLTWREVL